MDGSGTLKRILSPFYNILGVLFLTLPLEGTFLFPYYYWLWPKYFWKHPCPSELSNSG
jgi:hypothetical protein